MAFTTAFPGNVAGLASRLGPTRYAIRSPSLHRSHWGWGSGRHSAAGPSGTSAVRLRGRHLLDYEALTCLLVLLFVNEPKLNTTRLQRVLRNLCYHGPTRSWVIRSLLSMLQKTGECKVTGEGKSADGKLKKKSSSECGASSSSQQAVSNSVKTQDSRTPQQASWLSISLDAALGCHANVFQVQRSSQSSSSKKHNPGGTSGNVMISVHPQASSFVCRHVLDTLISLAKSFPSQFLPQPKAKEAKCDSNRRDSEKDREKEKANPNVASSPGRSVSKQQHQQQPPESEFWDLLGKLDALSSSRKGKGFQRVHSGMSIEAEQVVTTFDGSALGQLMMMLAHPVMRHSQMLTDRLLRLLGLVSIGLPDITQSTAPGTSVTQSTSVTTTAGWFWEFSFNMEQVKLDFKRFFSKYCSVFSYQL